MTNTFASIVVGVLLTSRLHTISGSIFRQKTAVQNPDLADVVFVANLLFTFNARSPADCARACLGNHGCLTYTITPGAAATSCRGHTSVMTSSDANLPMPGTTLFTFAPWVNTDCASDYDCPAENAECFVDKCLCTPGFYFSLSRHTCSAACNEADLQGVYLEYPGYFIQSHNMALYFRDTTEQCLAECTGVTNCRTVDPAYDGSRHCGLQTVTALDVPASFVYSGSHSHFQRCCI